MRLDWLDDLLAVLEQGSLSRAAESRQLTQPAFSRRIKAIEDYLRSSEKVLVMHNEDDLTLLVARRPRPASSGR